MHLPPFQPTVKQRLYSIQISAANISTSDSASNIFTNEENTLSGNVKNIVILIPNEGHHGQARMMKQDLLLNHSFLKL